MTSYHGGKQRIGKKITAKICDITEKYVEEGFKLTGYTEPFCGMLGVYQHIPECLGSSRTRLQYRAGDVNKSVILMWKSAQKGWKPPTAKISKQKFYDLKEGKTPSKDKGFIGHVYSFRGLFFGGYFPHNISRVKHSSENVSRIAKELKKVKFSAGGYEQYSGLKGNVIYCDPPYQGTQQKYGADVKNRLKFDSVKFWAWCMKMSEKNLVFVSEYKIPKNVKAKKVWSQGKEKLYLINP